MIRNPTKPAPAPLPGDEVLATESARTAGFIGVGGDFEKQLLAMTPLGRIGQPSDIGRIAVFLASDEANWLTGEIILASGGLR